MEQQDYSEMVVDSSFNWMAVIMPIIYVGAIVYFGYQTWELVDHLFPAEQLSMKIGTVLTFDFMAAIWLAVKMFARFRVWSNYGMAKGMWRITFTLATAASAIQMYLQAVSFTYGSVDTRIIYIAYALVVVAAVVNICAIGHFLNTEWDAAHPRKFMPAPHGGNVMITRGAHTYSPPAPARIAQPKEEQSYAQTATIEAPRQLKQLPEMKRKGKPGRKLTDVKYARRWYGWEDKGLTPETCPWGENRYTEYKNRYPHVTREEAFA